MLPESLTLGQRTLEDVFLELTGRELTADERRGHLHPAPRRRAVPAAGRSPRPRMEARLMLRNGEQLLLAVVIPVIVLVGGVDGARPASASTSPTAPSTCSPPACWRWR